MIAEQQNKPTDADRKRRKSKADQLLEVLVEGPRTSQELVERCGHRFSASVHKLRERGYVIEQDETVRGEILWRLLGLQERVKVTPEMKEAYYTSGHWRRTRSIRLAFDRRACVMCGVQLDLEVHHWQYDLFAEKQHDLSTLCEACHEWTHGNPNISIHFPHFVSPEVGAKLAALLQPQQGHPTPCPT